MSHKHLAALVFLLILTLSFKVDSATKYPSIEPSIIDIPSMCTELVGKCTGSAYCTACSNCSRCGHCNSGGSCGVCGKSVKTYRPKKRQKTTSSNKYNNKKTTLPSSFQSTHLKDDTYILTHKTSLRQAASSRASVLKRLAKNDSVQIVDGFSEKYWCKVVFKGKLGWVKKHLLEKRETVVYP